MGCLSSKPKNKLNSSNAPAFTERVSVDGVVTKTEEIRRQVSTVNEFMIHINPIGKDIRKYYDGLEPEALEAKKRAPHLATFNSDDNNAPDNQLGEGNWGKVLRVTRKDDRREFACKVLRLSNAISQRRLRELRDEIRLLAKIDHPNIAKLYATYEDEGLTLYLLMELLKGGELFTRLTVESPNSRFTEVQARNTTRQMVSAISYLHSRGIIHRDLKLENFVYRYRGADELVLIDFGLSARYNPLTPKTMRDIVGSSYYIAPEVLLRHHGIECDMWSLGVIVFMLLSGSPPFKGETEKKIMEHALSGKYRMTRNPWPSISPEAKDFVSRCLIKDVNERMTAREGLEHPWLSPDMNIQDQGEQKIDDSVVSNLREYAQFANFKKLALQAVAYSLSHEQIRELEGVFKKVDRDGDGYITVLELEEALRDKMEATEARKIFQAMDFDHTGKIHCTEFVAAALGERYYRDELVIQHAFNRLDLDSNGVIDPDELSSLLGKNEKNIKNHKFVHDAIQETCEQVQGKDGAALKGITVSDFIRLMRDSHEENLLEVRRSTVNSVWEVNENGMPENVSQRLHIDPREMVLSDNSSGDEH